MEGRGASHRVLGKLEGRGCKDKDLDLTSKNTLLKQDSITNRDSVVTKELLVWGFYLRRAKP